MIKNVTITKMELMRPKLLNDLDILITPRWLIRMNSRAMNEGVQAVLDELLISGEESKKFRGRGGWGRIKS